MTPTFEEFLKTGRIGGLAPGMTREAVRELLGVPDATSVQKHPEVWKYGVCQLAFDRQSKRSDARLMSISYDFQPQESDPTQRPELTFTDWFPGPETTREQVARYLERIQVNRVGGNGAGPSQYDVLDSSARVFFESDRLWSASYSDQAESNLKQLSITIPLEQFRVIQQEAKSQGLSVSALCSSWVSDHVAANLVRTNAELGSITS